MDQEQTDRSASVRASDADRERVVELLKERVADGTLTLSELLERVERTLTARTRDELSEIVADLPASAIRRSTAARHRVLAIMSGSHTRGRWRCDGHITAVAVMGGCQIDLRHAEILAPEVHITAVAVMGGIDIVVPEGVPVTMDGLPVMGGRSMQVKNRAPFPGAPHIVVHAYPIMGGVHVRSRPTKLTTAVVEPVDAAAALPPAPTLPLDGPVTVMFCDISDYTGLTERLGDAAAHRLLQDYVAVVRNLATGERGSVLKSTGDGLMLGFTGVTAALRCAEAIQRAFSARIPTDGAERIRVHIGVHVGEVVRDGEDILGRAVNIASRLADAAEADEVLVSAVARELASGSRDFDFDDARLVPLKGVSDPHEAYPLRWRLADGSAPTRPLPRAASEEPDASIRRT